MITHSSSRRPDGPKATAATSSYAITGWPASHSARFSRTSTSIA